MCNSEDNYVELLVEIGDHLIPLDEKYFYSSSSKWVEFFRGNIESWFDGRHRFVVIDDEYWLMLFVAIIEGVENWDISHVNLDDMESAKKLVKLLSFVEEIGSSMH